MASNPDLGETFQKTIQSAEGFAVELFEKLADSISGAADSLRDGTELEPVDLPRDLFAHSRSQTEWWYYTGHGKTETGKEFGFELVFFKRRTDLDRFSVVPLRLFGNPIYFAHFALTDVQAGKFKYAHRKSSNGWFDLPAAASETHYYLRLGDWNIRESHGKHLLTASTNGGTLFQASLHPRKGPVLNGRGKDGVSFKDEGEASRYFSYTRMEMEGDLTIDGNVEHFSGSAWMDREFGTWTATEKQKGWDWFSIQFEDNTELMVYQLRDGDNNISEFSSGVSVEDSGSHDFLSHECFKIKPTGYWKSPGTRATYPCGWEIEIPSKGMKVLVEPIIEDQELDTRGTTMIVYWEGACKVTATREGEKLRGRAYVELVGYDRSHDSPNLAYFLMGNHFESHPE